MPTVFIPFICAIISPILFLGFIILIYIFGPIIMFFFLLTLLIAGLGFIGYLIGQILCFNKGIK